MKAARLPLLALGTVDLMTSTAVKMPSPVAVYDSSGALPRAAIARA